VKTLLIETLLPLMQYCLCVAFVIN